MHDKRVDPKEVRTAYALRLYAVLAVSFAAVSVLLWPQQLSGVASCMMSAASIFTSLKHTQHLGNLQHVPGSGFQRLRSGIVPTEYRVHLHPDILALSFNGTVQISASVTEPIDSIEIHAPKDSIQIQSLSLWLGHLRIPVSFAHLPSNPRILRITKKLVYSPRYFLPSPDYRIQIAFTGKILEEASTGFYRSAYAVQGSSTPRYVAATQFESLMARTAYPCFDEPALKAVFYFSFTLPFRWSVLSNSEIASVKRDPAFPPEYGLMLHEFKPTIPISTYLTAWVIHQYDYIEASAREGLSVRAWAPRDNVLDMQFVVQVASAVVPKFEALFDMPLPLEKIDLAAIPVFSGQLNELPAS
eukprot:jgi/Hompol1/4279/HPOL_003577-RA